MNRDHWYRGRIRSLDLDCRSGTPWQIAALVLLIVLVLLDLDRTLIGAVR